MQQTDFKNFTLRLTGLAEVFDKPITPALIQVYFSALSDLDADAVYGALSASAARLKWFPKPVEIRELIEGTSADRGQIAWETLTAAIKRFGAYTSVQFAEPALADAILETFGGWIEACTKLPPTEDPMHASFRKRFEVAYELARKKSTHRTQYLVGIAEAGNRNSGAISREFTQIVGLVEGYGQMREIAARFDVAGRLTAESRALLGMGTAPEAEGAGEGMQAIGRMLRLVGKGVA
ncbi:MAG: hypothetical protein ACO24O_08085 [Arenimonas sp.]